MCTLGNAEWPEIYTESMPKARKQHKCCECHSQIDKGEQYWRIDGKWDGEFTSYKMCLVCETIFKEAQSVLSDKIPFECLYEIVGNDFDYIIREEK